MRFIYTKTFAIFCLCLVIIAGTAILQIKGYSDPLKNIFLQSPRPIVYTLKNFARGTKNFFFTVYNLRKIAQDNGNLTNKVTLLEQDLATFEQEKRDNEALRLELGFVKTSKLNLAPCTLLASNAFNLTDSIILNCGSQQGVSEGQAVISKGFLVGKIVYAGKSSSNALLVTSSKFSADAAVSRTGKTGLVKGSFGLGLILDQLSQNDVLDKGALVVTAGINEKIPKGILIGEVGETLSASSDLFKRVTLVSPVDFSNLEFVFVAK